jgi:hypothetical protein
MTTTQTDDAEIDERQAREAENMAQQIWKLMVDLTVEEKALVVDQLTKLLALEEASHQTPQ